MEESGKAKLFTPSVTEQNVLRH